MTVSVISPGVLSSFQDLGRHGCQHLGVPVSGAMDCRAHRLANLLVGNPGDEATLEVTLIGPTLRFNQPACIAISGANLSATVNRQAVPNNRPLILHAGDILAFGARMAGTRAYIAWHGGINLPTVLGSRSTYLRGQFGGYKGRALKKDDILAMRYELAPQALDVLAADLWKLKIYLPAILGTMPRNIIRVLRSADAQLFTAQSVHDFFNAQYRISANSDRMGYLLEGPKLALEHSRQLLSEATSFGTIQVPNDGNPIVLMADRQTTGGYTKIAHVATVDLPAVAQSMPGETMRFNEIELGHAQQLDNQREEAFGRLYQTLTPLRQLLEFYREERHDHA